MTPRFRLSTGELTRYSLSCGYIYLIDKDNKRLTLWREHGVFHVRYSDMSEKNQVKEWKVYESDELTEARIHYYELAKQLFGYTRIQAIRAACYN